MNNETQQADKKIINRLRRIEGQIRGIENMVTRGEDIMNIIVQTKAIKSALAAIETGLLREHLGKELPINQQEQLEKVMRHFA